MKPSKRLLLYSLIALFLLPRGFANDLATYQEFFTTNRTKLETEHAQGESETDALYLRKLEELRVSFTRSGDLNGVLDVKQEIEFVNAGTRKPPESTSEQITKLRGIYSKHLDQLASDRDAKLVDLTKRYAAALENLQKQYVRSGQIDEALAVRAELEGLEIPEAAPPRPIPLPSAPRSGTGELSVLWSGPQDSTRVQVTENGKPEVLTMSFQGETEITGQGLLCENGRATVDNLGERISRACRESNALTVQVSFSTRNLHQTGPARILTVSNGGHERNFTIFQENQQVGLRLRTTGTGDNGSSPQNEFFPIRKNTKMHVLISYKPGTLVTYVNGRQVAVSNPVDGDFSGWEEFGFAIGNEINSNRQWNGAIHRFRIMNRFVDDAEAQRLSRGF